MSKGTELPLIEEIHTDLRYVIQEHNASHLHWDFRLEKDGTLKSWALPKEPPTAAGPRRLAVQVADHDLDYGDFDGTIPEGNYGAGTVKIWDQGTYNIVEWSDDKVVADIHGKKLKGLYYLIRTKPNEEPKNWLFFKKKTE